MNPEATVMLSPPGANYSDEVGLNALNGSFVYDSEECLEGALLDQVEIRYALIVAYILVFFLCLAFLVRKPDLNPSPFAVVSGALTTTLCLFFHGENEDALETFVRIDQQYVHHCCDMCAQVDEDGDKLFPG
ncbi:hypothetical protein DdX_18279 [Ditylenchus destructor]|uniref:Uncharacterized protein n=1 Tax=Ditylenchus destructor TaxID=166010 RepID=A0AAD4MMM2_9BILA|nr:hypothetical protein DdX_18279 [Ditylenchus destructor]